MAVPKLRTGSYFPDWLLERRKRTESALITVLADAYLAGVCTRRMDKLVGALDVSSLSKSHVWRLSSTSTSPPSVTGPWATPAPFIFVAADAPTMKVRQGGRVVSAVVLTATGVNADGHRRSWACR